MLAVAGKAGAGKDTFIEYFKEFIPNKWTDCQTGVFLTSLLAERLSTTPEQINNDKTKYREMLQSLGDEIEQRGPAELMRMLMALTGDANCIVNSVRRASEVWYLKRFEPVFVVIEASDEKRADRRGGLPGSTHATEVEAINALKDDKEAKVVFITNDDDKEMLRLAAKQVAMELLNIK